ncbi:hypothetical protein B9Z55_022886 [Caenorhabditis nigoni]|uniref:Uncharacterized protein n=1 Tax=Caenorhabditis nigoni TaxID=1611254 RepID=A0A2G5SMY2_9PELO|nr:hypothetical protein B9Z55_022886 [Caenorhabditis nigoni]
MQTTTGPRSWTVRIECISSWKDFYSNQDGTMAPQKKHLNVIDTIANWLERAQYERSGSMDTFVLPPHEIVSLSTTFSGITEKDLSV